MIRKAVIPAAGFGTRFLPVAKASPKEMLPLIDTPVIQFVVEEAVASGITDLLIVTGRGKQAIENYFDRTYELEADLEARGQLQQLRMVRRLAEMAVVHYVRQVELRGLGHAIGCARAHVGNEPFVVLLGDTIIRDGMPCSRQIVDVHNRLGGGVIAVEEVPPEAVERYGIVSAEPVEPGVYRIRGLVEKPSRSRAPSNLAIAGRYVLPPTVFDVIDRTPPGKNGEIQLTDAINALVSGGEPFFAFKIPGVRRDIGNRLEYAKTFIEIAWEHNDIGPEFREFLRAFVREREAPSST